MYELLLYAKGYRSSTVKLSVVKCAVLSNAVDQGMNFVFCTTINHTVVPGIDCLQQFPLAILYHGNTMHVSSWVY